MADTINLGPNQPFETRVQSFPTGLVGTVGVRILDNLGATVLPRKTDYIIEDPPDSGSYVTTLRSPPREGQYSVFWDWDGETIISPSHTAFDILFVVGSVADIEDLTQVQVMYSIQHPHFDLPFRLEARKFAVVEQDTQEDVYNCVEAILRTTVGTRWYVPNFGIPDPTFRISPMDARQLYSQISLNEPRARTLITVGLDDIDHLIEKIRVEVGRNA